MLSCSLHQDAWNEIMILTKIYIRLPVNDQETAFKVAFTLAERFCSQVKPVMNYNLIWCDLVQF